MSGYVIEGNQEDGTMTNNGRGLKLGNEYIGELGKLYAETPKAVFAAIAISMCYIDVEEASFQAATIRLKEEWEALYMNGIVPQRPPKL